METPKTLMEAIRFFSDEDRAHDYLVASRWPNGVTCPHCESVEVVYMANYKRWKCRGCRKQFGAKYGTIYQNSPLPLSQWLTATWLLLNCKNGISSIVSSPFCKIPAHPFGCSLHSPVNVR